MRFSRNRFSLPGLPALVPGWDRGEDWNGWACPYFTVGQGLALARLIARVPGFGHMWFEPINDRFVVQREDGPLPEYYAGEVVVNGTMRVYPIGTRVWIWSHDRTSPPDGPTRACPGGGDPSSYDENALLDDMATAEILQVLPRAVPEKPILNVPGYDTVPVRHCSVCHGIAHQVPVEPEELRVFDDDATLRFSDGVSFNLRGDYRIEARHDGLYVVGNGILCAVNGHDEGLQLICDLTTDRTSR